MIRHIGTPAIAAACHVSTWTVRRWRKAQLAGHEPPIDLRAAVNGRLWVSGEAVEAFFNGGRMVGRKIEESVQARIRRFREGRCLCRKSRYQKQVQELRDGGGRARSSAPSCTQAP